MPFSDAGQTLSNTRGGRSTATVFSSKELQKCTAHELSPVNPVPQLPIRRLGLRLPAGLFHTVSRMFQLGGALLRHLLLEALATHLSRWPLLARVLQPPGYDRPTSEPEKLRAILEDLGGTFVKLGQMLALQPDLLPVDYCNALLQLLDRIRPVEGAAIEKILEAELGAPLSEVFETFEAQPLASASIGQVHVAVHKGKKVAVKVQRPGAAESFTGDLRLIRWALFFVRVLRVRRLSWLLEPLDEFVSWTEEELDYRNEARYMLEMSQPSRTASPSPSHQHIPQVFPELTTRRVLTVELLQGPTLLDYLRIVEHESQGPEVASISRRTLEHLREGGFDPVVFAQNLVDNFLFQVFRLGIFHADLHPANLLILPGNTVGYIDFGITGSLSPFSRRHLVSLTLATARGDLEEMAKAMFRVSRLEEGDLPAFRSGLGELAETWYQGSDGNKKLQRSFTWVMLDMLHLSRSTSVWPERDVIKYIRSAMAIDGLMQRFAPELDLSRHLAVSCSRHLRTHAMASRLSGPHWISWTRASLRLLTGGGLRLATLLDRWTEPRRRALASPFARKTGAAHPRPLLGKLSLLVVLLCLLPGSVFQVLGTGLEHAQILLAVAIAFHLAAPVRPARFQGGKEHA